MFLMCYKSFAPYFTQKPSAHCRGRLLPFCSCIDSRENRIKQQDQIGSDAMESHPEFVYVQQESERQAREDEAQEILDALVAQRGDGSAQTRRDGSVPIASHASSACVGDVGARARRHPGKWRAHGGQWVHAAMVKTSPWSSDELWQHSAYPQLREILPQGGHPEVRRNHLYRKLKKYLLEAKTSDSSSTTTYI